ncbi:MAG TPA: LysR family transcriptional regulator [Pseudonocardia sp.]|nr:LysR family transcriptional regulator [Pseudonocardia sp.]
MQYDLIDLRLFVHVVTEGSITAGARRMHLSLPSASARVRALEHHAGVPLLLRGRRGVRPTPAGTALARHARDVLVQTARLEGAVAGYARSPAAPVTLLAGSSALHRLVPRALVSFLREHPDRDVTVTERRSLHTVRLLTDGAADLGIVIDEEAHGSGLAAEPLRDDSLVVIGQAGGVLTGRTGLTYREAAEHPLVGLGAGSPLQRAIDVHVGPRAPVARFRTRAGNLHTLIALAAAGVGLAVVPLAAVDTGEPLDVCELQDPWARRRLMLCWGATAQRTDGPAATFARHLRQAAAPADGANGTWPNPVENDGMVINRAIRSP